MFWLLEACGAAAVVGLWVCSRKAYTLLRFVLRVQVVFWALAFLARPAYQYVHKPPFGESMYDPRLAASDYVSGMIEPMRIAVGGLFIYLAAVFFARRIWYGNLFRGGSRLFGVKQYVSTPLLTRSARNLIVTVWVIGWLGRIALLGGSGSAARGVSAFALPAACLLIYRGRWPSRVATTCWLTFCMCAELGAAFGFSQKTPIIAALLALALRYQSVSRSRFVRLTALALLGAAALSVFIVLQSFRGVTTAEDKARQASSWSAFAYGSAVGVLNRTDLFEAVVDANLARPYAPISPKSEAQRVLIGVIPKGPWYDPAATSGQIWARDVRSVSFPNQYRDVSLAEGATAEGFVTFGWYGVAAELVILLMVVLGACRLTSSPEPGRALAGATFVFSPLLLERGTIGLAEGVARAVEAGALAYALTAVQRTVTSKAEHGRAHASGGEVPLLGSKVSHRLVSR